MSQVIRCCVLIALCGGGCGSARSGGGQAADPISGAAGTGAAPVAGEAASAASSAASATAGTGGGAGQPSEPVAGAAGNEAGAGAIDEPTAGEMAEPEVWDSLIAGDWEVAPSSEAYFCVRRTLTEDVFVSAFKAQNPLGTHHTVLTVGEAGSEPDGITPCNSGVNARAGVFGSGVGTDRLVMPQGVAFPLRAGQQLILNLHLFNVADEPLSGTSGTLVQAVSEDAVEHLAESALVTALRLNIPPGQSVQTGRCTMTHDVTVFAVLPHMHMLGTRFKAAVTRSGNTITLHDQPFEFESQMVYPIEPVQLTQGEVVETECTYDNTTDSVVTFGESSLDEMCNFGLFRYPAGASPSFACSF